MASGANWNRSQSSVSDGCLTRHIKPHRCFKDVSYVAERILFLVTKLSRLHDEPSDFWHQILWEPLTDSCHAPQGEVLSLKEVLQPSITGSEVNVTYE